MVKRAPGSDCREMASLSVQQAQPNHGSALLEIADIMDLENSLRRLDGDKSLLIDLIGFYLEDYPSLLVRMDEAAAANDAASLERAAHSMKGLVANFDAVAPKISLSRSKRLQSNATWRGLPAD